METDSTSALPELIDDRFLSDFCWENSIRNSGRSLRRIAEIFKLLLTHYSPDKTKHHILVIGRWGHYWWPLKSRDLSMAKEIYDESYYFPYKDRDHPGRASRVELMDYETKKVLLKLHHNRNFYFYRLECPSDKFYSMSKVFLRSRKTIDKILYHWNSR